MSDPAHEPNVHPDLSLGEITAMELLRTRHPRATEALMALDNDARSRVLDLLSAESQAPEAPSVDAKVASTEDPPALKGALSLKADPAVSVEKLAPLAYGVAWVFSASLALVITSLVRFVSEELRLDVPDVILLLLLLVTVVGLMSYSRLFIDLCRANGRILAELRDGAMDRGDEDSDQSHDEEVVDHDESNSLEL